MSNLVVALGLVLVIEGALWALAPGLGRKFLEVAAQTPESPCVWWERERPRPACF